MVTLAARADTLNLETRPPVEEVKWCPGCNCTRTLDHFTPLSIGVPYYRPYCNQCVSPSLHRRGGGRFTHLLEQYEHRYACLQSGEGPSSSTERELSINRRRSEHYGVNDVIPVDSLVRITNYSPFHGRKGIIRKIDTIFDDGEEPFCFYLVRLEGTQLKEPMWFEYDEVELITSPLVTSQVNA